MPTPEQTRARAELRDWYTQGLRPKLALAARSKAVHPARVLALDRQIRALLELSDRDREVA